MVDKLDTLLEMIDAKKVEHQQTSRYTEDILRALIGLPDAFLYLYENLSASQKPKILTSDKKLTVFGENFFYVMQSMPDKVFNEYFFHEIYEGIDIAKLRIESIKRKDNQKLADFVKEKDKFKNVDALLNALCSVHNDRKRMYELIDENKEILKRLNQLNKFNSRALEQLSNLLNLELKNNGLSGVLEVSEKLGYDLLNRSQFLKNKLSFSYHTILIKEKDIETIEEISAMFPGKKKIKILEELTDFIHYPINIIQKNLMSSPKVGLYLWKIYAEFLLDLPNTNGMYNLYNHDKDDEGRPFEILRRVLNNEKIYRNIGIFNYYSSGDIVNELEKTINMIELNEKLNEHVVNKNVKNKFKL